MTAVMRINTDGTLDTTFGGGGTGWVITDVGPGNEFPYALALQSDGKIVVATGSVYTTGGCGCAQIIEICGYGQGHTKFGCSNSVMDWWTGLYDREGEAPFQCKDD